MTLNWTRSRVKLGWLKLFASSSSEFSSFHMSNEWIIILYLNALLGWILKFYGSTTSTVGTINKLENKLSNYPPIRIIGLLLVLDRANPSMSSCPPNTAFFFMTAAAICCSISSLLKPSSKKSNKFQSFKNIKNECSKSLLNTSHTLHNA